MTTISSVRTNQVEIQAGCGAAHKYYEGEVSIVVPRQKQDYVTIELKLAEGQYTTINIGTGVVEELARTAKEMEER